VNRQTPDLVQQLVLVPPDGEVLASQLALDGRYKQAFAFTQARGNGFFIHQASVACCHRTPGYGL
jgi:hypothetical protein